VDEALVALPEIRRGLVATDRLAEIRALLEAPLTIAL
jgi:hypothetical protein